MLTKKRFSWVALVALVAMALGCGKVETTAPTGADAGIATTSTCGDTTWSKTNCGRCGHDCLGGECARGKCAPFVFYEGSVDSMLVEGEHLYVNDGHAIVRMDKMAMEVVSSPEVLHRSVDPIGEAARSGDELYWTVSGRLEGGGRGEPGNVVPSTGSVMRRDANGMVTSIATSVDGPRAIAVDDIHVYWGQPNGVFRAPRLGGPVTVVAKLDEPPVLAVAVDERSVFFADTYSIRGLDKTTLASSLELRVPISISLRVHDGGLYSFTPYHFTRVGEAGPPARSVNFTRYAAVDGSQVAYIEGDEGVRLGPIATTNDTVIIGEQVYAGPVTAVAIDERAYYIAHRGGALRRLAR